MVLTACSGLPAEDKVVLQTDYVEENVPIQARPKGVDFPPVYWYVITEQNLEEKLAEIEASTGNMVLFVITPKGYENLAMGIAELRRYVKDQQAIIGYYEEALAPNDPTQPTTKGTN